MELNDFAYIVNSEKNFEDAVVSVLKSVDKKGWAVFSIYDLKERLAAKGFNHEKMKIIEICSAKHADRFLSKNKLASLCMPCKINVLENNNSIMIAGMRPAIISQFFDEFNKNDIEEVEAELKEMIENAK